MLQKMIISLGMLMVLGCGDDGDKKRQPNPKDDEVGAATQCFQPHMSSLLAAKNEQKSFIKIVATVAMGCQASEFELKSVAATLGGAS